ncbi:MAG: prepilin-type N-terminal cleavage/methylation domain-containing protein [Nitrospinae bacterium]|nr:prepilin-type N-terminal cleavage/methylation domain-containing protein [Nitrospinota bacterium]
MERTMDLGFKSEIRNPKSKIQNKPRRAESGFSLIELIVVLVIVGIAMAITAPFIFWTLERVQIRAAVKEIASSLRYGRSMAISQKKEVRFYIDLDEQQFWIITAKEDRDLKGIEESGLLEEEGIQEDTEKALVPKKTVELKKHSISQLVRLDIFTGGGEEIDFGTVKIAFTPFGNCTGGLIHIITAQETKRPLFFEIEVDPVTGRVKTKEMEEEQ